MTVRPCACRDDADPEQLKAQARMMKNMDKNTVRRMNPQFANMSDQELDMMASHSA